MNVILIILLAVGSVLGLSLIVLLLRALHTMKQHDKNIMASLRKSGNETDLS